MIVADGLVKRFRVPRARAGRFGGLLDLLRPTYDIVDALDGVSFDIRKGATVAYIGPNGAGKSTTIKILSGVMTPTEGRCLVAGLEPYRDRSRNARNIGVVFGQRSQLWWDLPVLDSFRILKRIYDVPDDVYRRNMRLFDELLDLSALGTKPTRTLSLGQRMRTEIAASLLHDPKVLFLDEDAVIGDLLADLPIGTTVGRVAPRRLRIDFSTTSSTPQHILAALGQHVEIHDFYAPEPSLEDVIKAIYRRPRAAA